MSIKGTDSNNNKVNIFPIGYVFISTSNIDPSTMYEGVWTPIKDVFLLTAGDTYHAGETGGEAVHTLSVDEMPSHNHTSQSHSHSCSMYKSSGESDSTIRFSTSYVNTYKGTKSTGSATVTINYTGGGLAHNNMPPYKVVYAWERTA